MLALAPTRVFTGTEMIEGATVHMRAGRIIDLTTTSSSAAIRLEGLLAPGLIDVQVNGGAGIMFNDEPTVGALTTIAQAHAQFGVTGFMATLISDERTKIAKAIAAVGDAIDAGLPGLMGLHLEGPWLSEPRRGVHPTRFLRGLDAADLRLLTAPRSYPILVTLSPEKVSDGDVKALTDAGVIVSIGHTAASCEETDAVIAAGARGFTHLFNAMPPLEGRKPGPVGSALANRNVWAGLILDGIHVHPLSARVALAAKSARRLMLVSDAMATVGSTSGSMMLFGEMIALSDGALRTPAGTLAGAHLDLSTAARNAVSMLGVTPEEALRMASLTPAEFLKVDHARGRIAIGGRADLVLFGSGLEVRSVWIGGQHVH
jgi:N-acetylglucosamine-6-phosphate deacetylase